jgi:farnesyl-diphosphate farnesyltransferase
MMALMGVIVVFVSIVMIGFAWYFGARFDLAWQELRKGNFRPPKHLRDREL